MSIALITQPNQHDLYAKDLTLTGNLNLTGDIELDDVIFSGVLSQPEARGAIGNGVANDTVPIQAAVNAAAGNKIYGAHKKYNVTSISNPLGVPFDNNLQIVSGGEMVNSYCKDMTNLIWGKEYLGAFLTKLKAFQNAKVIMTGDSTTAGAYAFDYFDMPLQGITSTILGRLFCADGFTNVEVINTAVYGAQTQTWRDTLLPLDIAMNPDLYIIRWGINNMSTSTIPDFATIFRTGMTTLRAALPASQTSVIIMCTNNVIGGGANSVVCEEYNKIFRQCADEFSCAFFDTYALMNKHADYMFKDNLHPSELYNNVMMSLLYNTIISDSFKAIYNSRVPSSNFANNTKLIIGQEETSKMGISGATLNPEWSAGNYYNYVTRYTGANTITTDGTWINVPPLTRIMYPLNTLVDNGGSFCVRFHFKPQYNGGTHDDLIIFDLGYGTGWIVPPTPYSVRLMHGTGAGALSVQVSDGVGGYLIYTAFAVFNCASGTDYEIEFDYDAAADSFDCFVDGQRIAPAPVVGAHFVRPPQNALSFGQQYMNMSGIFNVNKIQFFNSVQHTSNWNPVPLLTTSITNDNYYLGTNKLFQRFDTPCTISGPWAAPLVGAYTVIRMFKTVTLTFATSITGLVTVPSFYWDFNAAIPTTFVNTAHIVDCLIPITNAAAETYGLVKIAPTGLWQMVSQTVLSGTAGTTTGGFSITYLVDL